MKTNNLKRKKPDDIVFKMKGGELLVWKFKGASRKDPPHVSIFIGFDFDPQHGLVYHMELDSKIVTIPNNRFVLWDNLSTY